MACNRLLSCLLRLLFASLVTRGGVDVCSGIKSEEELLLDYLFKDYNPSARPVINSTKTVDVKLQFSLLQIQELNVRNQVLTSTGVLILDWRDERLAWTKKISSLDEIVVFGENIWRPEFALINGAESIYGEYKEFQATLRSDGSIRWEPGGIFKTMCSIDITYYPFDDQRCELVFGAWSYYTTKMNLTTDTTTVNLLTYEKNGEWEIMGTSSVRREFNFECCPHQRFSNIAFSIELRRRHTFYVMNVILPGILTSAVLLCIFFCIPSQKIHIGVAALLSFRLFLVNVADTIPRTSDHVPLLGIYLTCIMAITTLAMVATVFVGNLYEVNDRPVPPWARRVLMAHIARLLCIFDCAQDDWKLYDKQTKDKENEDGERKRERGAAGEAFHLVTIFNPYTSSAPRHRICRRSSASESKTKENGNEEVLLRHHRSIDRRTLRIVRGEKDHVTNSTSGPATNKTSTDLVSLISGAIPALGSSIPAPPLVPALALTAPAPVAAAIGKGSGGNFSRDWSHVAAVCDRFFFWLCLVFIVVTTLLLFHPLSTSRLFRIPDLYRTSK